MIRTGIYGGSFNPVHCGHLSLAERFLAISGLDEVWFMVSPMNPFKESSPDLLEDSRRLELVRRCVRGRLGLKASDYEFSLSRPSYTWNTLCHLSADYPDREFVLLVGADNWVSFDHWRNYRQLLEKYDIVVYPRKGYAIEESGLPKRVSLLPMPLLDVSSTEIRRRVKNGESIHGLVPDLIEDEVRALYLR